MPPLFFQGQVTQSAQLGYECCCVTGLCLAAPSWSGALGGAWGGDAQDGHPRVGLGCWGLGTARLLPRTVVATATEVLGYGFDGPCGQRGACGQARAQWDIPDTVCCGLKPPSQLPPGDPRAGWESGGTVSLGSCQDHHTASNCPHLLRLWTCFQQPSKYSSCNPNSFNLSPKPAVLAGGSCKREKLPHSGIT